jgi:hypothetical protein
MLALTSRRVLAGGFLLLAASTAHAQYSVTDLGTLGGATSSGNGIGLAGVV